MLTTFLYIVKSRENPKNPSAQNFIFHLMKNILTTLKLPPLPLF